MPKMRAGMIKSLEKRPVGLEALEASVERICHRLRNFGEREVDSRIIGELVMEELRQLDEVAYVRFASVYHRFQDVDEFREQLEQLDSSRRRDPAAGQLPLLPGTGQGKARK
jgi:transcriptional repressor NrdR